MLNHTTFCTADYYFKIPNGAANAKWDTLASFFIKFCTNYCYMCVEIMSKVQIFSVGKVTN